LSFEIGTQVGDYRILARVGTGAYGEVFQAEHLITHRVDAIKVLSHHCPDNSEDGQRFIKEIQLQASLSHPNIAAVHNAFWIGERVALVMELVPGEALSAILQRGRVPLVPGIAYVLGTLSALAYAHSRGIVHRDIKPENIIVTPEDGVKLTDFGLAHSPSSPRAVENGEFAGSPIYMSPEQVLATGEIDGRSDLYSTGVILYEIATGRPPFPGDTAFAVMLGHQRATPEAPRRINRAIPPALEQVILTALQKDPARRFPNANEFQRALHQAALLAVPASRHRYLPIAAAAAVALLGFIPLWFVPHSRSAAASRIPEQPGTASGTATPSVSPAPAAPAAEPVAAIPEPALVETSKPRPPKKRAGPARSQTARYTASIEDADPKPLPRPVLPAAPAVQPKTAAEVEVAALPPALAAEGPDEPPAPPVEEPAPKHHNRVIRTLQRIFHGKKAEK